ncbi:MAG TPA: sterol desaturase family protein [Mariprofundaceae bacterium]|nr:sterol desaturase family protein [Mariprofundaceae bacterium]
MENAEQIRLPIFLGILAVMALWEIAAPRRQLGQPKGGRWASNLLLVAIDSVLVRLLIPMGATGAALWAANHGIGLLHVVELPATVAIVLAVIVLDLVIYAQHVAFHAVPILWRLHMLHHSDRDIDASTALRFHPLEIILSMLIKIAVVILIGAPALAVLLFEVILNGMAMFNHGNVRLPAPVDRLLRLAVVTPDMHRVHHSVIRRETNSNFGFNLSLWDRLFGTYRPQPEAGHDGMTIGLDQFQQSPTANLKWMLGLPWRGELGQYPGRIHDKGVAHE